MAKKEIIGETPYGGVKSVAFYLDKNGNECEEQDAFQIIIHEYDKDGYVIGTVISYTEETKGPPPVLE